MSFRYTNSALVHHNAPQEVARLQEIQKEINELNERRHNLHTHISECAAKLKKGQDKLAKLSQACDDAEAKRLDTTAEISKQYLILVDLLARIKDFSKTLEGKKAELQALEVRMPQLIDSYNVWQAMQGQLEDFKMAKMVLNSSTCLASPLTRSIQYQQTEKEISRYIQSLIMFKTSITRLCFIKIEDANIMILPLDVYSCIFFYLDIAALGKLAMTCKYIQKLLYKYIATTKDTLFYMKETAKRRVYVPLLIMPEKNVLIHGTVKIYTIRGNRSRLKIEIPFEMNKKHGLTMLYRKGAYKGYITFVEDTLMGPLALNNKDGALWIAMMFHGIQSQSYVYNADGNIIDRNGILSITWPHFVLPLSSSNNKHQWIKSVTTSSLKLTAEL